MNAYEREQEILKLLHQEGKVTVKGLSSLFETSEVTIRSDLTDLEAKGYLSRVHGGAVGKHKTYYNMDMQERINVNAESKKRIAERIVPMIADNSVVMFGAGTTSLFVFRMIPPSYHLNIVTNYIPLALEAAANPELNVVLVGGQVNYKYQFTYGDETITSLQQFHADTLILSIHGISADSGLTTYFNYEAGVNRAMLNLCKEKIVAVDSSKFGRVAFAKIADFDAVDHIVTNDDPEKLDVFEDIMHYTSKLIIA